MFKRYPYWGWLVLCILFWSAAGYRYYTHTAMLSPANMAKAVQSELNRQERQFNKLIRDTSLIKRVFNDRLKDKELEYLVSQPFRLFAYTNNTELVFWNNNKILEDCSRAEEGKTNIIKNERGVYIKKCFTPPGYPSSRKLVVLFPIVKLYPFQNNYLYSHFIAADYIPADTRISSKATIGSYEVKNIDGVTVLYLLFPDDYVGSWIPDATMLWLLGIAILLSIGWIHLVTITLTRKRSFSIGFFITIGFIVVFRILTYTYGYPFNLEQFRIFSPLLYASSNFLRSLGDVLINALCYLWIIVFILRHVPYRQIQDIRLLPAWRWGLGIFISAATILYAFGFINIVRSLVLDSMISFDVSHFKSVKSYTVLGLLTIGIITGASCILIHIINTVLNNIISVKWQKYFLIIVTGSLLILFSEKDITGLFSYFLLLWLILFIFLLDIPKLIDIKDILSPQMVFWGVFLCAFCTSILLYFNYRKEHETRKRFAEQVVYQKDELTVYTFKNTAQSIQRDRQLKLFFSNPSQQQRRNINERFDALYLGGQLNKYQAKVLLFDEEGSPMFNTDTTGYRSLLEQIRLAEPTSDTTLYYKEYDLSGHYYIAHIPVFSADSIPHIVGHVFIDLAVKDAEAESVYPELLQPGNVQATSNDVGYSYAVYVSSRLIAQTNDFSFPVYLVDTVQSVYTFFEWGKSSELWYKADNKKTVIVIYFSSTVTQAITLFSYLFGIQMVVVLLIVFYRISLSYLSKPKPYGKFINLTLRKRIHFSMLGIVFICFIIIGVVTIIFFNRQYAQSNSIQLRKVTRTVDRSIVQYMKSRAGLDNIDAFNEVAASPAFKYFISTLANIQKVDINIYNASGVLSVTSQENIYDKALLARIIMPDAYHNLYKKSSSLYIQKESIGRLSYLSSYTPIRDNDGYTIGYINVPYFASEKELEYQVSNIVVALINLYAFIFLISGLLTVFITQWITRTFNVVIDRFDKVNLTENELIDWPYEDEIGLLVREYNKMVRKVEENALLLAQSEREGAWREMAKQVAHEIKNPLTPMKLNIQYLQQALKIDQPNVKELAMRVSQSLIEQIDNLSYIANEFSSFAKMPEAKPEALDLNDILERAVAMYPDEADVKVNFNKFKEPLIVYSDRSQLSRVFSNLLENATQAIPDDALGIINVSLTVDGNNALISVTDNGKGVSKEIADKIFQPYFTTRSSGTGLGLAMTKKIIESWQGKIWFDTEEEKGTTFYILLPLLGA